MMASRDEFRISMKKHTKNRGLSQGTSKRNNQLIKVAGGGGRVVLFNSGKGSGIGG